jgi:hypothetical protein
MMSANTVVGGRDMFLFRNVIPHNLRVIYKDIGHLRPVYMLGYPMGNPPSPTLVPSGCQIGIQLERQFLENKALVYVDAVYN